MIILSLVIPYYNNYPQVAELVNLFVFDWLSGANPDFLSTLEIVIVDDCSNNSHVLNRSLADIVKSQKSIHLKEIRTLVNSGPVGAKRAGVQASKGDYIVIFDSDDLPVTSFFQKLLLAIKHIELIANEPTSIVFPCRRLQSKVSHGNNVPNNILIITEVMLLSVFENQELMYVIHRCHRNLIYGFNQRTCEGQSILAMLSSGVKFYFYPEALRIYIITKSSITATRWSDKRYLAELICYHKKCMQVAITKFHAWILLKSAVKYLTYSLALKTKST